RMQPQLFVARDFEHLFEVLAEFEATLAWKRGGDYGLGEALRAGTVNHLVLADGREVTARVAELLPGLHPVAEGLSTALVRLDGPVLVSRGGKAEGKPWPGLALVAFGDGELPDQGPFQLELASGLQLQGFAAGGGEVLNLRGQLAGRPVALPSVAQLFLTSRLPSVAGGPADPGTWDRWFGELNAFTEGEGEAQARAKKASALHPSLAALYREVRAQRDSKSLDVRRLEQIARAASDFPEDWLLRTEIDELKPARA
ncbi:MAG TPA: phenylalanine 4-monooxygenase, partial [Cystobacter sp.]